MIRKLHRLATEYPIIRTILWGPISIRRSYLRLKEPRASEVLKRLESLVVGDLAIRMEEFEGAEFIIPATSHLFQRAARNGFYEPEWARTFLSHVEQGMDVVDIGANVGFYTVAAAKKGARVLAIEPTEGAFKRLHANVERNGVADRTILFNGLAADHNDHAEMHVVEGLEEYSSLAPIPEPYIRGHQSSTISLPARTIDSLVQEYRLSPRLIKVDVEGAEVQVFRGAAETLAKHRPAVMSELSNMLMGRFGTNCDDVVRIFVGLGYDLRGPDGGEAHQGDDGYGEVLFVPR